MVVTVCVCVCVCIKGRRKKKSFILCVSDDKKKINACKVFPISIN
jgi:hypothetical protein